MADSITARSGWDKRVEVVKKLTDPNRKVNCQKCQKGASKSALLSWRNEHTTITVETRWDEFYMPSFGTTAYENGLGFQKPWTYVVVRLSGA
jgi:hypothetical protein